MANVFRVSSRLLALILFLTFSCIGTIVQAESSVDENASLPDRKIGPIPSGGADFLGLGLLKKNTVDTCESAINRATEIFWDCHGGLISETSSEGDIQINLAEKKFVLSRDLSRSTDREFDELMTIVDALPSLVTYACYPARQISDVPITVAEDLKVADITYSGNIRRLIETDENLTRWELDAYDVYKTLSSYCPEYYCEFADLRTSLKFWKCNSADLRETIYIENKALNVILSDGSFTITRHHNNASDAPETHLDRFVADLGVLMESIACHPEASLMDVPLSGEHTSSRPTTIDIDSLGKIMPSGDNQLTFKADAYKVYTGVGRKCLD